MALEAGTDPFSGPRDLREQFANDVVREHFAKRAPAEAVYRQDGDGYCLIAQQGSGARGLTVPAANEADFMFHGNPGRTGEDLAEFIADAAVRSGVDHLRLPLLSQEQAAFLRAQLGRRLPEWVFGDGLASVSPVTRARPATVPDSFRRAMRKAGQAGYSIELSSRFDTAELVPLHEMRWGKGSRGSSFFEMLSRLLSEGCAEYIVARDDNGTLVGAQVDILGSSTRHFYYCVNNSAVLAGIGTAVMGFSWKRFVESDGEEIYSFGRGAEPYKYRYADGVRAWFELRGFYAPGRLSAG